MPTDVDLVHQHPSLVKKRDDALFFEVINFTFSISVSVMVKYKIQFILRTFQNKINMV